jgi:hypothetical protein
VEKVDLTGHLTLYIIIPRGLRNVKIVLAKYSKNNLSLFPETESSYVVQTDLKLVILLSQPPECWDYWHAPPYLA